MISLPSALANNTRGSNDNGEQIAKAADCHQRTKGCYCPAVTEHGDEEEACSEFFRSSNTFLWN